MKFLVYERTTQTTCLRLMGKKMLVALMMEGKFSGEGIHSLETDEDMMSAMARELVERGGVGETAAVIWADLKRERSLQLPERPAMPMPALDTEDEEEGDKLLPLLSGAEVPQLSLPIVSSNPKVPQKPSTLWPTGFEEGEQLLLFG